MYNKGLYLLRGNGLGINHDAVSYVWDDTDGRRRVEVLPLNCDEVLVQIERNTLDDTQAEFIGQLSDGLFENDHNLRIVKSIFFNI